MEEIKKLVVRKFGWKRICHNQERFGWELAEAVQEDEVKERTTYEGNVSGDTLYVKPHTTRRTKTRIHLTFYRDIEKLPNFSGGIIALEFFYNVSFVFRTIFAFFAPFAAIAIVILALLGGKNGNPASILEERIYGLPDYNITYGGVILCILGGWLLFIIFETIFARIAQKKLKTEIY